MNINFNQGKRNLSRNKINKSSRPKLDEIDKNNYDMKQKQIMK